jgi:hypothetical protein
MNATAVVDHLGCQLNARFHIADVSLLGWRHVGRTNPAIPGVLLNCGGILCRMKLGVPVIAGLPDRLFALVSEASINKRSALSAACVINMSNHRLPAPKPTLVRDVAFLREPPAWNP